MSRSVPDLILLHGALGALEQLTPFVPLLAARFTAHPIEFEGHGGTAPADRPFRTEHFAENVLTYMDSRGLANAHVFGYSMGGYVALWLALSHPDRIRSVATLGTKLSWDPASAAKEAARLVPDVIRSRVPKFAQVLESRHAQAGGWELVLGRTAEMMRALGDAPTLSSAGLARISRPVRLMVGDRDAMVSLQETADAYRTLATGEFAVLPATPHPLEQVNAARLCHALMDFFAGD